MPDSPDASRPASDDAAPRRPVVQFTPPDATIDSSPRQDDILQTIDPTPYDSNSFAGSRSMSLSGRLPEIEGYEILSVLGRGGMGVVYKARQLGLDRLVALKMILAAGHAGPEQRARFEAEAKAVAKLHHPHIVQVYEVNESDGRPFFSLEYVNGGSLADWLMQEPAVGGGTPPVGARNTQVLSNRLAADLIEVLARTMHAAHELDIIHRDLKPANILLQKPTGSIMDTSRGSHLHMLPALGIPKITDFGLAKSVQSDSGQTQSGSVLGTPSYMAPEQAAGKTGEITRSVDIWALGAMLYELLVGRPPFVADSPFDILIKVMRDEPELPRMLVPKVARDVEIICLKCLDKNPLNRYATALELAEDLRRYLDGEPILARAAKPWERAAKWVRRHPAYAIVIGMAGLTAVGLAVSGVLYQRKIEAALGVAESQRDLANQTQRDSMRRLVRLTVAKGTQSLDAGDFFGALPWFAEALRLDADNPAGQEMHRIRLAAVLRRCPMLAEVWVHDGVVRDAAFSPDGRTVVTAGDDGNINVLDCVNLTKSAPLFTIPHEGGARYARFRPDGKQLVTLGADGVARLWKPDGEPLVTLAEGVQLVRYSPDGKIALTASSGGIVRAFETEAGTPMEYVVRLPSAVLDIAFSPQGEQFATACADGTVRTWETAVGEPTSGPSLVHKTAVECVAFRPDGHALITGTRGGEARVWAAWTGEAKPFTLRHAGAVRSAAFSPDGTFVLTTSEDGSARVWNAVTGDWVTHSLRHESRLTYGEFSPDGRWVVTAGEDNTARVWDTRTGEPVTPPLPHNGTVLRASFSPDGTELLTSTEAGIVRLWDLVSRSEGDDSGGEGAHVTSPDRRRYLTVSADGVARVWDAATREPVTPPLRHGGAVVAARFSPDGTRVVTASREGAARVWDAATGAPIGKPMRHGSALTDAVFSPDGSSVATASADNTARVWDASTGEPRTPPIPHPSTVARVAYSSDGRCLVTRLEVGGSRVWDATTGEVLTPKLGQAAWVDRAFDGGTSGWDLPADGRSTEELLLLSEWLLARRVDDTGGAVSIDRRELYEIGRKLATLWEPPTEAEWKARSRSWHLQASAEAEKAEDWFAARVQLDELLRATPDDAKLLDRRGRAFAEQNQWDRAAADFGKVLTLGEANEEAHISASVAQLAAAKHAALSESCHAMYQHFSKTAQGDLALRMAWPCLLEGGAHESLDELDKLITQGELGDPERSFARLTRGLWLYRAGKLDEAAKALRDSQVFADGGQLVASWALLAAIEHRQGRPDESKKWREQVEAWQKSDTRTWRWQRRAANRHLTIEMLSVLRESPTPIPIHKD